MIKVADNMLSTGKTILIQRNRCLLAGITVALSDFIYLLLMKNVLAADSIGAVFVVSAAGGLGCCVAVLIGDRLSEERLYVNVIMCDDIDAMRDMRDFLARNRITNVAADSYTLDWSRKTITITAYADTKAQNRLIDEYINSSEKRFKRVIQKQSGGRSYAGTGNDGSRKTDKQGKAEGDNRLDREGYKTAV